jgi:hypothetical protein
MPGHILGAESTGHIDLQGIDGGFGRREEHFDLRDQTFDDRRASRGIEILTIRLELATGDFQRLRVHIGNPFRAAQKRFAAVTTVLEQRFLERVEISHGSIFQERLAPPRCCCDFQTGVHSEVSWVEEPELMYWAAEIYRETDLLDQALALYEQVLALNPQFYQAWCGKAIVLRFLPPIVQGRVITQTDCS